MCTWVCDLISESYTSPPTTSGSPCLDHTQGSWEDDSFLAHYIRAGHITLRHTPVTYSHTYNTLTILICFHCYYFNNENNVPPSQTSQWYTHYSSGCPPASHPHSNTHTHPCVCVNCWAISRRYVWV